MSVLNVIDTQTITASQSGYVVVKSGVLRVLATSASSIQVDAGPAITLVANESLLISCGKAKSAKIAVATDAAAMVVTAEGFSGGGRHTDQWRHTPRLHRRRVDEQRAPERQGRRETGAGRPQIAKSQGQEAAAALNPLDKMRRLPHFAASF